MTAEPGAPDLPVLLIDDNPLNLRLAGFLLQSDGLEVRTADSAEQALRMLAGQQFSLVMVDIQLPGMDGLELTRRIRGTPAWEGLPVVALTAYAMPHDDERMQAAGCDGYISKPINTRTFAAEVRKYLTMREGDSDVVGGPEIAQLREEFVLQAGRDARALLSLPDAELGGDDTFVKLHRWAGFAASVGFGPLTDLARNACQYRGHPPAARGPLVRPVLISILAVLEAGAALTCNA